MKSLLAAGAAVAMLTLAFNAPLGADTAATPSATQSRPLALSDFLAPSSAYAATCEYKVGRCVEHEYSSDCASSGGNRYRTHTIITEKDCSTHGGFSDWSCSRPSYSDC